MNDCYNYFRRSRIRRMRRWRRLWVIWMIVFCFDFCCYYYSDIRFFWMMIGNLSFWRNILCNYIRFIMLVMIKRS